MRGLGYPSCPVVGTSPFTSNRRWSPMCHISEFGKPQLADAFGRGPTGCRILHLTCRMEGLYFSSSFCKKNKLRSCPDYAEPKANTYYGQHLLLPGCANYSSRSSDWSLKRDLQPTASRKVSLDIQANARRRFLRILHPTGIWYTMGTLSVQLAHRDICASGFTLLLGGTYLQSNLYAFWL
jgi:hypothetical protein